MVWPPESGWGEVGVPGHDSKIRRVRSAVVIAAVLLLVPVASAASGVVDCGAGASLQAAIDAAGPGSTLLINGTCVGSFLVTDKNLALVGARRAVLDGGNAGRVLYVSGWALSDMTVVVSNLAIRNGYADDGNGGGGLLVQVSHVTLRKVTVSGNTSVLGGGGIENDVGDLTLLDSTVRGNQATSDRGGGIASSSSNLTIRDSSVSTNSSGFAGGGIAITRAVAP
jgi:nitrous oxidase accessory protein NosD